MDFDKVLTNTKQNIIFPSSKYTIYPMKNSILTILFAMFLATSFAQQTLTQSFNPAGNDAIEIALKNNAYSATSGKVAKFLVQVEIKVNFPKEVIDQLILAGRYKVTSSALNRNFKIDAAALNQAVTVGGKALTEEIKITVTTPPLYTTRGNFITKDPSMKAIAEPMDVVITFVYPPITTTNNVGATSDGKTSTTPTLQEVQAKYGDIIINGRGIDFTK